LNTEAIVLSGALALFLIASVSGRIERLYLTEPLVATAIGLVIGLFVLEDGIDLENPLILTFLELTLALVLFSDASRIDLTKLAEGYSWPLRMLAVGMPVAIFLGTALSAWYLTLPVGVALLIGVILAPTDAALAEPVLASEIVPQRVRQSLNVESGLNDGLAVPVLLIAIGIIESTSDGSAGTAVGLVLGQLGIGIVGGIVLGWIGAKSIGAGAAAGWMNPLHQKIAAVFLALGGFAAVQLLGGSGFVATFIAGGLMAHVIRPRGEYLYEFADSEGHAMVLIAFLLVGAGPVTTMVRDGGPSIEAMVIALVSLLVLRPLAIAVSLAGQRLKLSTVSFLGWFGPRGLATIVFLLVAAEETDAIPAIVDEIVVTVVLASIVLHGLSAVPLSRRLARATSRMGADMPEMGQAFPHPMRRL
jgi:NhaP-type Na+/H+ or K+/H+ antiporter